MPRLVAIVFTAVAVVFAFLDAFVGEGEARYSPEVALLAATLVAIIWYTYFTYVSVADARARERSVEERNRQSIYTHATAIQNLLGELPSFDNEFQAKVRAASKIDETMVVRLLTLCSFGDASVASMGVEAYAALRPLVRALDETDSQGNIDPGAVQQTWDPMLTGAQEVVGQIVEATKRDNVSS